MPDKKTVAKMEKEFKVKFPELDVLFISVKGTCAFIWDSIDLFFHMAIMGKYSGN